VSFFAICKTSQPQACLSIFSLNRKFKTNLKKNISNICRDDDLDLQGPIKSQHHQKLCFNFTNFEDGASDESFQIQTNSIQGK